jgi:hypothetical protein
MRSRRRIGLGLVASGAVHAAAAVAVWLQSSQERTVAERELPEAEAVEIEFFEEDVSHQGETGAAREPQSTARIEAPARATGSREQTRPRAEDSPPVAPGETGPPPGSSSLRMRARGERAEDVPALDARRAAAATVVDPGPPPPPGPLEPPRRRKPARVRSELRPDGPGGYETVDGTFVARTGRDGRVTIEDRSSFNVNLPSPRQIVKEMARSLERWADDPRRYAEETGNENRPVIGGRFEVSDALTRLGGEDPYAARKLAFLDRTRGERMEMAASENSARLRAARQETWGRLKQLWRGPGTAAHKRHLLFMMWDECAETGSAEVVDTARAVRGTIVMFIERRLPAGSRDAYSAGELERYNARRTSTERFAPYAASPPAR